LLLQPEFTYLEVLSTESSVDATVLRNHVAQWRMWS
jgi:hypothetical protein